MKHFKLLLTIGIFFIYYQTLFGQEILKTYKNNIGLNIGSNFTLMKDLTFSPLNYSGTGINFEFNYIRNTQKSNLFFTDINLASTSFQTEASDYFEASLIKVNLEIGWLKKLKDQSPKLDFFLGSSFQSYVHYLDYLGGESISFMAFHGIQIIGKMDYSINERHQIQTSLSVPMFGLLVRPPHTGWDKFIDSASVGTVLTTGKWVSVKDFFSINGNLNYLLRISTKFDLIANYDFRFYQTKYQEEITIGNHFLTLGFQLKF